MTADPRTNPPVAVSAPASRSEENQAAESGSNHLDGAAMQAAQPSQIAACPPVWLLRVRALLFVTLCATFGVLLLILPWTPRWTDNPLLLTSPTLRDVVSSGFVRGLASGLGLLNLWLGFREAIFYHENPKSSS